MSTVHQVKPGDTIVVLHSGEQQGSLPPMPEQVQQIDLKINHRLPVPMHDGKVLYGKENAVKTKSSKPLMRVRHNGIMYGLFWAAVNGPEHRHPGHVVGLKRLTQKSNHTLMTRNFKERAKFVPACEVTC